MIFLLIISVFFLFDNVYATCYKIRDTHTGISRYSTSNKDVKSYEIAETTDATNCYPASYNDKVSCGHIGKINKKIPEITSWIITIAQILVPVILVIMGSIDFVKAISSQKEDEIKKGMQIFIKRLIVAIIIFFVVVLAKFVVSLFSSGKDESQSIIKCIDCFIRNECN